MRDRCLIALAVLVALGAALRFATLDLQSFWFDEAVTVGLVKRSLGDMLAHIPDSESTPPLYYVLAWLWSKPFGTGEVGLRSLSALFGTATIPAFYAAAAELSSRRVALAVAGLAAVNPLLIWYSQEARSYALLTLLAALSLAFFARLLHRPDRRTLVLWALTSALALTAHYFAMFVVFPEAVWLAARARDRRTALGAVGGVAAVAFALLPLALHQRALDLASFIRTAPLPVRLVKAGKQFLVGFESPIEVVVVAAAALIALTGLTLAYLRLRDRAGIRTAAALGALALALPLVMGLAGLDYFDTRNLIVAWLPLAVVMCAGLLTARGRIGVAALATLGALGLSSAVGVAVEPTWQRDNWRGAAKSLGPSKVPRAIVLTPRSGAQAFELYRLDARPMPAAGVPVREIAFVSKAGRRLGEIHPPPPPRPAVAPGVPGFSEVRRDYADTYTVIVERSPVPVTLQPGYLQNFRLVLQKTAARVLLQRPTR
jgi:mannosyltransferase